MPPKGNGPSRKQWEDHKEIILSLVGKREKNWEDIVRIMAEKYQFVASRQQYETQTRNWNAHRNLKRHEWQASIECLDTLSARHGKKIKMRILGEVVDERKLKRSRALYSQVESGPPTSADANVPQHVSFGFIGEDSTWTSIDHESGMPQPFTLDEDITELTPCFHTTTSSDVPRGNNYLTNQRAREDICTPTQSSLDTPIRTSPERNPHLVDTTTAQGRLTSVEQYSPISLSPLRPNLSLLPTQLNPSLFTALDGEFLPWSLSTITALPEFDNLKGLPFEKFQKLLKSHGIDLSNTSPKALQKWGTAPQTSVTRFLVHVESSRPDPREFNHPIQKPDQRFLLRCFGSLLPGEGCENHHDLITQENMLEAEFNRLLMFSIMNGFAGLDKIPIAAVYNFLGRYENISSFFSQVSRTRSDCVTRALAANIFKASIEARDGRMVLEIVKTRLVDINNMVCTVNRERFTAIERAACLEDLKITKILLDAQVDVNKTFSLGSSGSGALKRLIDQIFRANAPPGTTVTSDDLEIAKSLMQAGAKVRLDYIKRVLRRSHGMELACQLISALPQSQHMQIISEGTLTFVTRDFEEKQATDSVEHILQACIEKHNGECLHRFTGKVEWALVQGAKRGYLKVVQLLLPYAHSFHAVLSASLRSGNKEVIELVLAKKPNFKAPAHSIDEENWKPDYDGSHLNMTTPLAEAIEARNDDLIRLCENNNVLEHLMHGRHFEAAITAAAKIGNIPYIDKLLQHNPSARPTEMAYALVHLIQNEHEQTFFRLLEMGTHIDFQHEASSSDLFPLLVAVKKRNSRILRALLDVYPTINYSMTYRDQANKTISLLDEAVRWGDRTIIEDLCRAFPAISFPVRSSALVEVLLSGDHDLFRFLVDRKLVRKNNLTDCLHTVIENNLTALIPKLLDLGADPSRSDVLDVALDNSIVLQLLLERIPPTLLVVTGLGASTVRQAIRKGISGLKALKILISSKVVDFHSFHNGFGGYYSSALGEAIETADDYQENFAVVRTLLDAGCDVNSIVSASVPVKPFNRTALLAAIDTKNENLVKLLIDHGAHVNTTATMGLKRTPLQRAAELGCLNIVRLLIQSRAEINASPATRGGGTALQFAAISGNCNIAAELLHHGADMNMPPSKINGRWPIEGAAEHGRIDMLEYLLKQTPHFEAEQRERAMKFAEDNGEFACRDYVRDWGVSYFLQSEEDSVNLFNWM